MRLAESERRIMEVLWAQGESPAKEVAKLLMEQLGWQKTTTYTMLTRCQQKNYLKRTDPHFVCTPLITREEVAQRETDLLIQSYFGGSAEALLQSLKDRGLLCAEG